MKIKIVLIFTTVLLSLTCSAPPKPFEIKDACSQPVGTNAVLQGYLSLPKTIDTIQLTKGGKIVDVGYQIFLMTKADATGDAVKVTIWTTNKAEPNRIKTFSSGYDWTDLLVYTDDGKEIPAGKVIKLTGEITADKKTGCALNVKKINLP